MAISDLDMRIFKYGPNVTNSIAGEIINLLTSVQYFDDGTLLLNPVKDYPQIVDGSTIYSIDLEKTFVYYPSGFDKTGQKNKIHDAIKELAKLLPESEKSKMYWNMKCDKSSLTVVRSKVMRSNISTLANNFEVETFNPEFGYSVSQGRYERFMRDCAIFVDTSDLVSLPHNSLTYDVSLNMFVGMHNILNVSFVHHNLTNPFAFELNPKFKLKKIKYHPIKKRLIRTSLENIKVVPVTQSNGNESIELCSICTAPLYDDNYVFEGHIATSDTNDRIVLCPLCAHYGTTYYDVNYFNVYIVKFPATVHDIIDLHYTEDQADVLHASVEKRQYFEFGEIVFIVLGKDEGRYIACTNPAGFVSSEVFKWYPKHKIVGFKQHY